MEIGYLIVTPEGLEALAKSMRTLNMKVGRFEVHQDDDTHKCVRICCTKESGWIDLLRNL